MEPPNPVAATMDLPSGAGKGGTPIDTALHGRQWPFMKGASRCWDHQQQQAIALRIQQPGLGAERFLARRIFCGGTQL